MKLPAALSVALAALPTLGAAPAIDRAPAGIFHVWGIHLAVPLRFTANGVSVDVAARPCQVPADTEGCRFDGINNQAEIIVRSPGLAPFRVASDRQASFVRVAVVPLDRRARRSGVVIDNQWGGSAGITKITVVEPVAGGFRAVPLRQRADTTELQGQVADRPRDLSGDGIVDVVLEDQRFGGFGCNACSPRPPLVLSAIGGRSVDLSARQSVRAVFAADLPRVRAICRSGQAERNGNCAAYLADAARLGRFAAAWRDMLAHYERGTSRDLWQGCTAALRDGVCPPGAATRYRSFPEKVRALLVRTGYITLAQAAAAPLA